MPNQSIICDIDGTLFNGKSPIQEVIDYLKDEATEYDVIIVSGRQDSQMQETRDLLNKYDVPHSQIHLSDFPKGAEVQFKKYKAKKLIDEGYDIAEAIDNDARAREAYSSLGIEEVINPSEITKESEEIEDKSKTMDYLLIENKVGKVKLNEAVTPYSIDVIIEEMGRLYGQNAIGTEIAGVTASADGALEEVVMEINSGGGSVLDGYRLYYAILAMRDRGVKVTAIINSLAASMASVIAMAADEIHMVKGGQMMIHDASLSSGGNASEHMQVSEFLDGISDEIADIYAGKSGMKKDVVRGMMKTETWLNADKAKAMGLVDKVIGSKFDTITKASMSILDKLLPNAELASKIEARDSEIKSLESAITEVSAKSAMIENELQNAITELTSVKAELDEKSEALKIAEEKIAEQESSITELAEKSEASADKISIEASRLLAATGHPTPIAEVSIDASVEVDHFAIMSKLSPEDRSAYYSQNRSKILSL